MVDVYKCYNEEVSMASVHPDKIAPSDGWVSYADYLDLLAVLEKLKLNPTKELKG